MPCVALAQWQLTAFVGDAATSPSRLTLTDGADDAVAADAVKFDDRSFVSPWYDGARLTRRIESHSWFGLEAEFIHAKAIADPNQLVRLAGNFDGAPIAGQHPLSTVLPRFELSHGLNFLLANAVFSWPSERRVIFVGRLGAGPTMPHVEVSTPETATDGYQWGGPALGLSVGSEVRLSTQLAAIVEFKLTHARQRLDVGSTSIEGVFTTRHLVVGASWRGRGRHRPFKQ